MSQKSIIEKEKKEVLTPAQLLTDLRLLIEESRQSVAIAVNYGMTLLYWQVGKRILTEVLNGERAEYGKQIVASVGRQLAFEYGKGFNEKNIRRMIQFAEVFPDQKILASLLRQLTWTHFRQLLPIKDDIKRDFYAEMCRVEKWNTRTLEKKIDSMLFERTVLSKKPERVIDAEIDSLRKEDQLTPDLVFKDPYILEFLKLDDHYMEKDLEDAIMRELQQFLLELGVGFTFVARQKRITVDETDFSMDLLLFHRRLRRLVVIELKLGDFKPEYKGQMELYLRWLDKYERNPGEEAPMGIILCTGKNQECVELLELHKAGIHLAEYLTYMPSKEELLKIVKNARRRISPRLEIQQGSD